MPGPAEPADAEVEVALAGFFVLCRGRVCFEVVARVFERDSVAALELVVVPFCDFGVGEQRVVAAEEARLYTAGDVVGGRVVPSCWVV